MTLVLRGISLNEEPLSQPLIGRFDERGGTLGRSDGATLTLPDPERMISRLQANVLFRDDEYWMENISAANPILHNGRALSTGMRVILRDGDEIRVGGYALEAAFENDDASATILRGRTVVPGLKERAAASRYVPPVRERAAPPPVTPPQPAPPLPRTRVTPAEQTEYLPPPGRERAAPAEQTEYLPPPGRERAAPAEQTEYLPPPGRERAAPADQTEYLPPSGRERPAPGERTEFLSPTGEWEAAYEPPPREPPVREPLAAKPSARQPLAPTRVTPEPPRTPREQQEPPLSPREAAWVTPESPRTPREQQEPLLPQREARRETLESPRVARQQQEPPLSPQELPRATPEPPRTPREQHEPSRVTPEQQEPLRPPREAARATPEPPRTPREQHEPSRVTPEQQESLRPPREAARMAPEPPRMSREQVEPPRAAPVPPPPHATEELPAHLASTLAEPLSSSVRSAFAEVRRQPPAGSGEAALLWLAFLEGAGVEVSAGVGPSPELMKSIGEMLKISVTAIQGLVTMRARAKNEMQADMTMMQPRDNNPLKFSPDAALALQMILKPAARGFLDGPQALRDAVGDLQSHQVGMTAGMRSVFEAVLERLDPQKIEGLPDSGSVLDRLNPGRRKARLWDLYAEEYRALREEARDNFQRYFGEALREAYEAQVHNLNAAPDRDGTETNPGGYLKPKGKPR